MLSVKVLVGFGVCFDLRAWFGGLSLLELWWMAALEWDQETTGARGRGKTRDSGLDTLTLWWDRQEQEGLEARLALDELIPWTLSWLDWWQNPASGPPTFVHPPYPLFLIVPGRRDLAFAYAQARMNAQGNLHILEFRRRQMYGGGQDYLISGILWKGLSFHF